MIGRRKKVAIELQERLKNLDDTKLKNEELIAKADSKKMNVLYRKLGKYLYEEYLRGNLIKALDVEVSEIINETLLKE